jgi:hypothetical protein
MFDCPSLEPELLDQIEAIASRPLAELLLQRGILRTMAQEILVRQLRDQVAFNREEEPVIISRLWEGVDGAAPTSLAGNWIAALPDGMQLGMGQRWDQIRLQKLMETRYQDRLEPYFLERRKELEQVVYGLIRLRNQGAAEELYLRLIDDGANFSDLAKVHSLGEERFTHGLVGPMLISQPHPTIRTVLESLKVGEVHAPFRVDQWVLLVQMEHRQPASLNDATRIQLMQELLQQEIDQTLDAMLAAFYPSLVLVEAPSAAGARVASEVPRPVEPIGGIEAEQGQETLEEVEVHAATDALAAVDVPAATEVHVSAEVLAVADALAAASFEPPVVAEDSSVVQVVAAVEAVGPAEVFSAADGPARGEVSAEVEAQVEVKVLAEVKDPWAAEPQVTAATPAEFEVLSAAEVITRPAPLAAAEVLAAVQPEAAVEAPADVPAAWSAETPAAVEAPSVVDSHGDVEPPSAAEGFSGAEVKAVIAAPAAGDRPSAADVPAIVEVPVEVEAPALDDDPWVAEPQAVGEAHSLPEAAIPAATSIQTI